DEMGAWRPFLLRRWGLSRRNAGTTRRTAMADMLATERTLSRDIVPAVERAVATTEVLAVELLSPSRFCVYVDHPEGVDHALCARVTEILSDYRGPDTLRVPSTL